jgi:hypothetical protein
MRGLIKKERRSAIGSEESAEKISIKICMMNAMGTPSGVKIK